MFRKDFIVVSPTLLERVDEYIVIKGIISHLSRFLKDDEASSDTFYYKVVCLK